jgi:hypothetical protein
VAALLLSFVSLILIFFMLFFNHEESSLHDILTVLFLVGISLSLALALFGQLIRPLKTLEKNSSYALEVNTDHAISQITKQNQIEFSRNYLIDKELGRTIEIDNKVAFKLMNEELNQIQSVTVKKRKTNFFESSPGELLSDIFTSIGSIH